MRIQGEPPAEIQLVAHPQDIKKHVDVPLVCWIVKNQAFAAIEQVETLVPEISRALEELLDSLRISAAAAEVDVAIGPGWVNAADAGALQVDGDSADQSERNRGVLGPLEEADGFRNRVGQRREVRSFSLR